MAASCRAFSLCANICSEDGFDLGYFLGKVLLLVRASAGANVGLDAENAIFVYKCMGLSDDTEDGIPGALCRRG